MRIISGTHKGRHIIPDNNFTARPTTDFAKENIFNVLTNLTDIENSKVLDLFSGTGSIAYEFASRGAGQIVSIELNFKHYAFIKRTISELKFNNIKLFKTDVFVACRKLKGQKFDIIFADPPYNLEKLTLIPNAVLDNDLLDANGYLIIEHPKHISFDQHPLFMEHREYGSVNFSIFHNKIEQ